jgi:recombination protein RecA
MNNPNLEQGKLPSQLQACEMLIDINKLLDEKAHQQGLTFTTMDAEQRVKNALSTGIFSLDLILGGGLSPGRFAYTFGPTGSAKSSLFFHIMKSTIERDVLVVFNDHEASTDPTYLEKIGISLNSDVCGYRNKKNQWEITPKLRYALGTTAEATFRFMNLVMRSLPDKIQLWDEKAEAFRYFLISPEYDYKPTWKSINDGLKASKNIKDSEKAKVVEVGDFAPQMVWVTDSLKSMLPEARDIDIDKDPIALLARCFASSFPLIKSLLGKKNCIYLASNHLTCNPLNMFGCLHADTPVPFVDESSHTMREIVENKIQGEVWSFDEKNSKFVPAKIVDWHYNGEIEKPEDHITLMCDAVDTANGLAAFTCTREHKVLTLEGWKRAEELTTDDLLVSKYESIINGSLKSFLLGTMVGDCTIQAKNPDAVHRFVFRDNANKDYLNWKLEKLEDFFDFKSYTDSHDLSYFVSNSRYELTLWKKRIRTEITDFWKGKNQIHLIRDATKVIDQMDDLSLALWFMDDGYGDFDNPTHFCGRWCVSRLKPFPDKLKQLQEGFARKGLECSINFKEGQLHFSRESFLNLCERICRFVPECMQYKLPLEFRGKYEEFCLTSIPTWEIQSIPIRRIHQKASYRKFQKKGKYDITVENFHNYMVGSKTNGVIVHNSSESEPGGTSVQFYPDLKLKMYVNRSQSKIITEPHFSGEGEDRYAMGRATIIKNKNGPCFRKIEFRIYLDEQGSVGRGIDPVFDVYTFLDSCGLIQKVSKTEFGINLKGWETSKFTWGSFKKFILQNPDAEKLKDDMRMLLIEGKAQEMYCANLVNANAKEKDKDKSSPMKDNEEEKIQEVEL